MKPRLHGGQGVSLNTGETLPGLVWIYPPVSGPCSFAMRPFSPMIVPLMFPAVALVFREVSPGAGVGVGALP